ncbi:MAG: hypothetical protein HFJ34_02415 [Clostridia bacterium]|nr:hypothetical protein [Clostridia bacterium]
MKKRKKELILLIIVVLILIIFLFPKNRNPNNQFQEDLLFFKLFSSNQESKQPTRLSKNPKNTNQVVYDFQVSYKNIDFKNINLNETIKQDTLIQEKIAPGTQGEFEILLQSNTKMNYQIKFKSTNEKPKNLNFRIKGKDRKYNQLEDMEQELQGEITKNKKITIEWKWDYEENDIQNFQDTEDGQKIKQYNFTIYTIGE